MIKLTDLLAEVLEENKTVLNEEVTQLNEIDPITGAIAGAALGTWRGVKGAQRAFKNTHGRGVGTYLKQFAKGALGLPDEQKAKKPGQTWKTKTGRVGAMNRNKNIRYFKDQESASKFAKL